MRADPPALALALALALGLGLGCNGADAASAAGGARIEIPSQPSPPASPATARVAPAAPSSVPDASAPVAATAHAEGDEEPEATRDAACGWVDPATVARPTSACGDDKGAAPACPAMKACTGVTFPRTKCEAFRKYFKPRVAQRALECLGKLSDKEACDACNAYRCGDLALKSACPDAAADAACVQMTRSCKAVSMAECQIYLSGMNAAGRAKIAGCLGAATGCGFGIFSCTEGLF